MRQARIMRNKRRASVELVLAVVAAAGAVWSWLAAQTVVTVAPVLPNEPQTTSTAYSAPLLVLMLILATVAGVLAVDGIARRRRVRGQSGPIPAKENSWS
jgi:hypothetical protein